VHDDGYFDERVAARDDESSAEMFHADVVDAAVDFLAGLPAKGARWSSRSGRPIALPLRGVSSASSRP
jgi:hypothetical protein